MKKTINVLDHGYVSLHSHMGDDLKIVNMARQSFGKKSEKLGDAEKGLINYLLKNRHGTPFEGVVFTFNVKCPIFVAREWMRHRIGCLSGDTDITCIQPNGTPYNRTIEHLYRTTKGVKLSEHWVKNGRGKNRKGARKLVPTKHSRTYCGERFLRVFGNNEFTTGQMLDIWKSGIKPLYLLKTKDGYNLKVSANHQILTPEGWAKVSDLSSTDAILRQGRIAINDRTLPWKLRQSIQEWTTLQKTNKEQPKYGARSKIGARSDRLIKKPELISEEMTYDIEMKGPYNNYLANRIIVHNSFNEYSGRYSKMISDFHTPKLEQMRTQKGKQGDYRFEPLAINVAQNISIKFNEIQEATWRTYEELLQLGAAKEVARMVLPVSIYTQFTWVVNLRSLFNFISLRSADNAMWEIRQYSQNIEKLIEPIVPIAYEAFNKYGRVAP